MTGIVGSTFSNSKVLGAADRLVIDGITSIATGDGGEQIYRHFMGNLSGEFNHETTAYTPRQQCTLTATWIGHHNFSSGARYFVIGIDAAGTDYSDDHFKQRSIAQELILTHGEVHFILIKQVDGMVFVKSLV